MHAKSLAGPVFLFSMFIMIIACDKTTDPPQVSVPVLTTTGVTGITSTSATSGGNITSDGGSSITASGVCWSTNATPTINDNVTTDGIGSGSFNSTITGLTANTTYSVRAYATNSAGTGYGNVLAFTSTTANGNTVTDIDGNVYHTVINGNQVWMAENLKTTRYCNGDPIPNVIDDAAWFNLTSDAYCNYDNNPDNANVYGRLYNWYTVSDNRKLAPEGWHIPTDTEWKTLIDYLGGFNVAGGKLKETGTSHWNSPNTGATNEYGFSSLPGGYRNPDGPFQHKGNIGFWWTATLDNTFSNRAWRLSWVNLYITVDRNSYYMMGGFSIRCVKD
jgi:uncharacterized protein (TIGR02145 family)